MTEQPAFIGLHFWVADMARCLDFYRAIGLDIPAGAESEPFLNLELPGGVHLAFATDEVTHWYDPTFVRGTGRVSNALQFALASRDAVDAMHAKLTSLGYESHLAPVDGHWGGRYCEVIDPDGNIAGFHSPRDR